MSRLAALDIVNGFLVVKVKMIAITLIGAIISMAINFMGLPAKFAQLIYGLPVLAVLLLAFTQTIRQRLA